MVEQSIPNFRLSSIPAVFLGSAKAARIPSLLFWLGLSLSWPYFVPPLPSAEIEWSGAVNDRFHEPDNWVGGVVPGADDSAIIVQTTSPNDNLFIGNDDRVRLGGFQIGRADEDRSLHELVMNDGELDVGQFTMRWGNGGLSTYEQFGGQLWTDELVFDGGAKGQATFQVQSGDVWIGAGGIRMPSHTDSTAEILLLFGSILDARDAGQTLFGEVGGRLRLHVDEGSLIQVAGNVSDISQVSDNVEFVPRRRPCEPKVVGFDFDYDPDSDTTDIYVVSGLTHALFPLFPGDADRDFDFDQLDLVRVQIAGKYLTGESATWGEGDWDGAPGGTPDNPPPGDGFFNQLDIVAALQAGIYSVCPHAVVQRASMSAQQLSIPYHATDPPGLSEDFLLGDLSVVGSLRGGAPLGDVDLIYVPEPQPLAMLTLGALILACLYRKPALCRSNLKFVSAVQK